MPSASNTQLTCCCCTLFIQRLEYFPDYIHLPIHSIKRKYTFRLSQLHNVGYLFTFESVQFVFV
jgi:hypothetical protein